MGQRAGQSVGAPPAPLGTAAPACASWLGNQTALEETLPAEMATPRPWPARPARQEQHARGACSQAPETSYAGEPSPSSRFADTSSAAAVQAADAQRGRQLQLALWGLPRPRPRTLADDEAAKDKEGGGAGVEPHNPIQDCAEQQALAHLQAGGKRRLDGPAAYGAAHRWLRGSPVVRRCAPRPHASQRLHACLSPSLPDGAPAAACRR